MKKLYSQFLCAAAVLLGLPAAPALAQVALTDFAPYTENFNTLPTSTDTTSFENNVTLRGVYAQAMLAVVGPYPKVGKKVPYAGNDGAQHPEAYYYSFGTAGSTERAFGGIATTFYSNGYPLTGNGYVAMRFVNNTGRPIANLEVSYAMEQWYNSGKVDKAQLVFGYQKLTGAFSGMMESGTWTNVPALGVDAPSTAMVIASKNGNAPANRRILSTTIPSLNLLVGQEVVLRWKYVMNANTNGNGLSIDDVSVTPEAGTTTLRGTSQANVFYYQAGEPTNLTSWASQADGTNPVTAPTSFSADNQVFYITTLNKQVILNGNLISGTNSKLVIGDGTSAVSVALTPDNRPAMTVNVASNGTLEIKGAAGALPKLGTLSPGSTVYYNTPRTNLPINCATFGNLKLNAGSAVLANNVSVNGNLTLSGNGILQLGVYDLTVLKGGVVTTDGTAYVRTNAGGALRQTVTNTGTAVLFPVGQLTYNPAWLSQTAAGTEDVFGVSLSDSVYVSYTTVPTASASDSKGAGRDKKGVGAPVTTFNTQVDHTWYVTEADPGHSLVTMTLQSALPSVINQGQVAVGHFHNGVWESDTKQKGAVATIDAANRVYQFTRTGITDFSPFGLNATTPLPVELLAFTAKRTGSAVTCAWATATEQHNDHFTLERSLDGLSFSALATIAGAGSTTSQHDYRWVDARPVSTVAYYRLRQVDTDGTESFSPVVAVLGTTLTDALTASPNPTAGPLVLTLSTTAATTVRGTVTNVLGMEVLHVAQAVEAGTQAVPLDMSALPAGVYLLRVETPQGLQTLRVIKQ